MTTLKDYSRQAALLAVEVAQEHHRGQSDHMTKLEVEKAVDALLQAKRHLVLAHRQLNGDDPLSGVA